jgi:hypothetical protein
LKPNVKEKYFHGPCHIEINAFGSKLIFIYFQPTLTSIEIQTYLGKMFNYTKPDLLIGDFNINFKKPFTDIEK